MGAGLIISSLLKFKLDNIDPQKLLLELNMELLLIYGLLLVLSLKWQLETFCLNLERVRHMEKMMTIWLK